MSSKPTITTFGNLTSLPCFSFNKDMTKIAVSDLESNGYIYKKSGNNWELECTLTEHSSRITGIDWDPVHNRIATSGCDRNAYVWVEDSKSPKKWIPTMVILRIDRAATCVKWSPCGLKFAVGTGSKEIPICSYDAKSNWWVCKKIRKGIKSTILSLDWSPDSSVVAAGSADFRTRVYYARISEIESEDKTNCWFSEKKAFGVMLAEYYTGNGGWVHSVAFSKDGTKLAFSTHDCCISVADRNIGAEHLKVEQLPIMPLISICWISDTMIAGAGYDFKPFTFSYSSDKIKMEQCLDKTESSQKSSATEGNAFSKFQNIDRYAQEKVVNIVTAVHTNCVRNIALLSCGKLATSGLDNQLVIWSL